MAAVICSREEGTSSGKKAKEGGKGKKAKERGKGKQGERGWGYVKGNRHTGGTTNKNLKI